MNILKFNEEKNTRKGIKLSFTKISLNLTIITVSLVLYWKPDHIRKVNDNLLFHILSLFHIKSEGNLMFLLNSYRTHPAQSVDHMNHLLRYLVPCVYLAPVSTRLHSSNTVYKEKKAVQQSHKL